MDRSESSLGDGLIRSEHHHYVATAVPPADAEVIGTVTTDENAPLIMSKAGKASAASATAVADDDARVSTAATAMTTDSGDDRIASLDQFRGWVVLSMITADAIGDMWNTPKVLTHQNTFFSWADAIMPRFFLMVGFAMELTLRRTVAKQGVRAMIKKQLKRSAVLILIGFFYYGLDGFETYAQLQESWWRIFEYLLWGMEFFQTLTVIGIAQILILPVITRPWPWRLLLFVVYHALYFGFDMAGWFPLLWDYVDGGSVGAFSYATVMIFGTFFVDWRVWAVHQLRPHGYLRRRAISWHKVQQIARVCAPLLLAGVVLMVAGVSLSTLPQSASPACSTRDRVFVPCPDVSVVSWPFVVPSSETLISMWTLTKRNSTNTFALFAAGWAVPAYLVFFVLADCFDITVPVLNVLGQSALLMYLLQDVPIRFAHAIFPPDSPAWILALLVPMVLAMAITIAYYLKNHNIAIRL